MEKQFQDGIILDHSFILKDEKSSGISLAGRALQLLTVILGGLYFALLLKESLVLPVNLLYITAAVLICSGFMFFLFRLSSYHLFIQFFCILFYGLFFYSRLSKIANGFYIIENLVIKRLSSNYGYQSQYFLANYTSRVKDTTLFIIMILIPVVTLLTASVVRNYLVKTCSMILLMPVLLSFLLGQIPPEKYVIPYLAVLLYLASIGVPYKNISNKDQINRIHRINSRVALGFCLMCLMLFFLLRFMITDKEDRNTNEIIGMKDKVQAAFTDFSYQDFTKQFSDYKIFKECSSVGGLQGGLLGRTGEVRYSNSDQLIVTVPTELIAKGIYLKGYVGSEYTGNSWEEHTREDRDKYSELSKKLPEKEFSPVNQASQLLNHVLKANKVTRRSALTMKRKEAPYEIYQGNYKIEYKEANKKYIYAPYYTDFDEPNKIFEKQDLYAAPIKKADKYKLDFYFNLDNSFNQLLSNQEGKPCRYPDYEKLYRDYVYQVYTKLPDQGLERLKKDFSRDSLKALDLTQKIEYVKNYLRKNAVYSLSPGELPNGKDFVEYFLYENKKGYCAHFASAAVLMLRSMGVPARYVEGYVIKPESAPVSKSQSLQKGKVYTADGRKQYAYPEAQISVKDSDAHAWVEVYFDGFGWLPVEFTPGISIDVDSLNQNLPLAKTISANGNNQKKNKQNQILNNKGNKQENTDFSRKTDGENHWSSGKTGLFIIFFILLFAASGLFVLIKVIRNSKIKRSFNHNKRAIDLFLEIEKILTCCNKIPPKHRLEDCVEYLEKQSLKEEAEEFVSCLEIVQKARFGKDMITSGELKRIEEFRNKQYIKMYNGLSFIKKLNLKFILLM